MIFSMLDKNYFQYQSGYTLMCVHFVILSIISWVGISLIVKAGLHSRIAPISRQTKTRLWCS